MNTRELRKRMNRKSAYWWARGQDGSYRLLSLGGYEIWHTMMRYEAELMHKSLSGSGMEIVGKVPADRWIVV